ncbi:MAG: BrnT family toxin [Bacteriovoracaceae bacterium]
MVFEWDPIKNQTNFKKHGISFEDAIPVFQDEHSLENSDSIFEDRFIRFGFNFHKGVLAVVYCEKYGVIRIISARKATKTEEKLYAQRIRS